MINAEWQHLCQSTRYINVNYDWNWIIMGCFFVIGDVGLASQAKQNPIFTPDTISKHHNTHGTLSPLSVSDLRVNLLETTLSDLETHCDVTVRSLQKYSLLISGVDDLNEIEMKTLLHFSDWLLHYYCRFTSCPAQYAVNGRASSRVPTVWHSFLITRAAILLTFAFDDRQSQSKPICITDNAKLFDCNNFRPNTLSS